MYERIHTTDPRLGRHVNHDPRSRAYAFKAPRQIDLVSVRHTRLIPVLDQLDIGACTGSTGIGTMGTVPFANTLDHSPFNQDMAVQLYSEATAIDEWPGQYPPDDTGSSGLSVAKILKARGWVSGYRHTFTFEDMQAALQFTPVMLGINWYSSFYFPNKEGEVSISSLASVVGGHEIVVDEIDMEKGRFGMTNSWGPEWGLNGRFYIDFATMRRLLAEQGDVVVLVPKTEPAPAPDPVVEVTEPVVEESVVPPLVPWWKRLLTFLMRLFGLR